MRRETLLLIVVVALSHRLNAAETKKADVRDALPTVGLINGQAIVGEVLEPELIVETRYGQLKIPFDEVVRVRLALTLPDDQKSRFAALEKIVETKSGDVDAAIAKMKAMGLPAFHAIRKLQERLDAGSRKSRLGTLLEEYQGQRSVWFAAFDEIVTQRFTLRGRVVQDKLKVKCTFGVLELPRSDVQHIAYRELDLSKTFKVTGTHMENRNHLVTKLEVRKNQKIKLEASGVMNWQGQGFGPAGISNHTWNSRKMGCLQWRIGSKGPWKVLNNKFEGKADAAGDIQFCIHLTGNAASGEFKVVFSTKLK